MTHRLLKSIFLNFQTWDLLVNFCYCLLLGLIDLRPEKMFCMISVLSYLCSVVLKFYGQFLQIFHVYLKLMCIMYFLGTVVSIRLRLFNNSVKVFYTYCSLFLKSLREIYIKSHIMIVDLYICPWRPPHSLSLPSRSSPSHILIMFLGSYKYWNNSYNSNILYLLYVLVYLWQCLFLKVYLFKF